MTDFISETLLSPLSEFVAARMGLHFPKERWRDLTRGIHSAAQEFDFKDAESCARWLLSSPLTQGQIETLAHHLTIGETYFFREEKALEAITGRILPDLIRSRRESEQYLRIWSAGCSTGEEAYSVAILLDRLFAHVKGWQLTILATDINTHALQKASTGVYSEWSFRGTPAWVKENYFERQKGDRYEVLPRIKRMVKFSYLNLAEDAYPALLSNTNAMDIILCRNVLMYFTREQAQKVVNKFFPSLVTGGWLVVNPSELSTELFSEFTSVNFPGAILYQKEDAELHLKTVFGGEQDNESAILAQPFFGLTVGTEMEEAPSPESSGILSLEVDARRETPASAPTWYRDASAFYEQGRYREAVAMLQELVSSGQADIAAYALLGRAYANQGQLDEALEWCEKAIAIDKTDARSHYLRATILQELNRAEEATGSLRRALFLDQHFVLAHFALGNLTRQQGKHKESERHLTNALALLRASGQEDKLPESEGMTAGRLVEIIRQMMISEAAA
jgi:chemotaxis protein methyltransferase CheR